MNQFNALNGDKQKEAPREWNSQPPAAHFKSSSSPSRKNTVVSAITGKLNHHVINNGDITSDVPVESRHGFVPDPEITHIKSIDGYGMYYLLEFFHSEHDDNILDVELQMLQA